MYLKNKIREKLADRKTLAHQLQKIAIITLVFAGLSLNTGFSKELEKIGIQTIYHVYSNGSYLGAMSDITKIDELKEQKLQQATSEFENLHLAFNEEISVVSERVFAADANDDAVLEQLQQSLEVEAEAVGIVIDEELELHVKDMTAYEEIIRTLKLQSVTEEELNEFEARESSTDALPTIKENETRITNIILTSDIEPVTRQTHPDNVVSADDALQVLTKGTLEEKKYTVQSGDVISIIANSHDMSTQELLSINPGMTAETVIQPGDELNVTKLEPLIAVEVHYETKQREVIKHKSLTENDNTIYKGEKKVVRQGSDGERLVVKAIRKQNGQVVGSSVVEETILLEAVDQITAVGTKVIPSRGTGTFIWPTVGGYVSSKMGPRWGSYHKGIDIARPSSRAIRAADNGVVTFTGYQGNYGNKIEITHNNGYKTVYAHLSKIDVKRGQTVPQGTQIGVMGSTGRSTGTHLHFEVYRNGKLINPLSVLRR